MEFREICSTVIKAMFSDDVLMEKLVLKGGNAIDIGYNLGARASTDVDFSISEDFSDLPDIKIRVLRSLTDRFNSIGLLVFDLTLESKPKSSKDPRWGGYRICFKLIDETKANLDATDRQRQAIPVTPPTKGGTQGSSKFRIEISKYEFCEGYQEREIDHFPIRIYSHEMIVIEKLRALCQQMPEGGRGEAITARARDFFDIYKLITQSKLDLATAPNPSIAAKIFKAKEVPISLLWTLPQYRDFHRPDWPSVESSVSGKGKLETFDFYFDFVCKEVDRLKSSWVE